MYLQRIGINCNGFSAKGNYLIYILCLVVDLRFCTSTQLNHIRLLLYSNLLSFSFIYCILFITDISEGSMRAILQLFFSLSQFKPKGNQA